jgi:hypothetical protein
MTVTVIPVPKTKETAFRGVAYLVLPEDENVTAAPMIEVLAKSDSAERSKLWSRFDYWLDGGVKDEYFHGWNEAGYEHCFVFKWNTKKGMQRLYGTLFHPKRRTNRRFLVCVLFSHAVKPGKHTDPAQKKRAEALYRNAQVIAAVAKRYPDR